MIYLFIEISNENRCTISTGMANIAGNIITGFISGVFFKLTLDHFKKPDIRNANGDISGYDYNNKYRNTCNFGYVSTKNWHGESEYNDVVLSNSLFCYVDGEYRKIVHVPNDAKITVFNEFDESPEGHISYYTRVQCDKIILK